MKRQVPQLASHLRSLLQEQSAGVARSYATSNQLAIRGVDAVKGGQGGRSSVSGVTATIFGCTGFLGRYVAQSLGAMGCQVVLPYRCDAVDMQHLRTMGDLGQIVTLPDFNIRDDDQIRRAISRSQLVINLIGAERETWNYNFEEVHVDIPQRIAQLIKENGGVQRYLHFSHLKADPNAPSRRLRTKAAGEEAVKAAIGDITTIFKPAHVTGTEDRLFNIYASLMKKLPIFPLVDGGETKLQPVWVRDVQAAVMNSLATFDSIGKTYHLAGPDVFTVKELVKFTFDTIREPYAALPVPAVLAKAAAGPGEWLARKTPFRPISPMFTTDAIEELSIDHTLPASGVLTLDDLEVKPHRVTEGLPIEYLRFYRSGGYDFGSTNVEGSTGR